MVNSKMDEFKLFVKANPFLITYIRDGKKSWQDLYEMYDIFEDDEEAWNKYLEDNVDNNREESKKDNKSSSSFSEHIDDFIKMAKNVDVDKVQEGISSLQKTLTLFGDLFINNKNGGNSKNYNPRPLYRRFDD